MPRRTLNSGHACRTAAVAAAVAALLACPLPASMPVAASPSEPAAVAVAMPPVSDVLDDFDDPKREGDALVPRPPNDFFGNQGPWDDAGAIIDDTVVCTETFSCHLSLAYDLSSPAASGGYWEELAYDYSTAPWPARDLRRYEQFRLRARGDPAAGYPASFEVEFIGRDWGQRAAYAVSGLTAAWQVFTLDLAARPAFDWSAVKQVAIKLSRAGLADKTGRVYFDDLAFVDLDPEGKLHDLLARRAFDYFRDSRHPATGYVRDRATDPFCPRNVTSIAAIGYELAAFGIAAEHGWISRADAAAATRQVLRALAAAPQGPGAGGTAGYKGFFYHFLDIAAGVRAPDSELSTVDTALLMAGVLFAKNIFSGPGEADIRALAAQLYDRVEWDWVLRRDAEPAVKANTLYMAWKPERHDCEDSGYDNCFEIPDAAGGYGYFSGEWIPGPPVVVHPTTWDYATDEIVLLNLLAIGSPTHGIPPATFQAWQRVNGSYGPYSLCQSWTGSLFTYFIGQGWLDLRCVAESPAGISWWRNSGQAALANRQYAIDHAGECAGYSAQSWGLSAGLGPPADPYDPSCAGLGEYRVYAGLPRPDPGELPNDCTLTPYAAAGSLIFLGGDPAANPAYAALAHWYAAEPRLWGLYGFRDGFNANRGWYAHDAIGLDQGMTLLALDAYDERVVWRTLSAEPGVRRALAAVFGQAGCLYLPLAHR